MESVGAGARTGRSALVIERFGLRLVLIAAGLLIAAIPFLLLLILVQSGWEPLHRLDFNTADSLNRYIFGRQGQITGWKVVSAVGGPTVFRVAAAVAAVVLWLLRRRRAAVLVAVTMVGAAILSGGTKLLVNRIRPALTNPVDQAAGASFPSGHSLTSLVFVGLALVMVLPLVARRWRPVLVAAGVLIVGTIGFSRLILGDHFVSDVLGGWLIGVAWLLVVNGALHVAAAPDPGAEQAAPADALQTGDPDSQRRV